MARREDEGGGIGGVIAEQLETRRLLAAAAQSAWAFPDAGGRLQYGAAASGDRIPDFSRVGYKSGTVALPNTPGGVGVPVKRTVTPGAAGVDMTAAIQAAIDDVEDDPLDANGFRGAVRLAAGEYPVSGTLTINASGVVLIGDGDSLGGGGTVIRATGTSQRFLLSAAGSGSRASVSNTSHTITDAYLPVGASSFHLNNTTNLAVGDKIVVHRPSTANWIHDIGMDLLDNPWTAGSKDLNFERTVTAISGTQVSVDIPLTNSFDQNYGGGDIYEYTYSGRITQVGISDIYFISDEASRTDLAHATGSITMDKIENGWIHNVTSDRFAVNQIVLSGGTKFMTVDDVVIQNTSTGDQAPPAGLSLNGPLALAQHIQMHGVYHAIALTSTVPGPNVIYDVTADGTGSDCGPHQRWSTGGLFDDVTIVGNDLQAFNRGNSGTGHGWAGANYVFWNCAARNLEIANPPTAQNWAIGCIGTKTDDGNFDSLGVNVTPTSLYQKQLWDRTHANPLITTPAAATPNPRSGGTVNLSVAASATAPLLYTWSVVSKPAGAADPTYSVNGATGASNTVATVTAPGTYIFKVTAADAGGLLASSTVIVTDRPTTTMNGDQQSPNQNDVFLISRSGNTINVLRNGSNILAQDYATSPQLAINAAGGNDTINIDLSGGNPIPASGFIVDGGAGTLDTIVVTAAGTADVVSLATGNVAINTLVFGYASAEMMTLNLGSGGDVLSVSGGGNAAVTTAALNLNVSGGTLSMGSSSTLPDFTDLDVAAGATFDLNGQNQTLDAFTGVGTIRNGAGGGTATLAVGKYNGNGSFGGTIINGAGTLALTKHGTGTLTLSGANSYTGTTIINGGVIASGNAASLAGTDSPVFFNGGTFHVTANTDSKNIANKYSTTFIGATSASTAAFDIDAGVTFSVGTAGGLAGMRTNGGGSHGGTFTKLGLGTLRILSNNGQFDDPFKLNAGTVIVESATGLGGADNSSNHADMKSGATLVLRQNTPTNFLTPINVVDPGASVNVVLDRQTAGAGLTHSVNALTTAGAATVNFSAGANVTASVAGLTIGASTLAGDATLNVASGNAAVTITGVVAGGFALTKNGAGLVTFGASNAFAGVTINAGTLALAPGGTRVLKTAALAVNGTARLDLTDNDLAIDYAPAAASPIGTKSGVAYTGVTGMIQRSYNFGAWTGNGIVTSRPDAANGLTTLGVAEAADTLNLVAGATALWDGLVVDNTTVLVKYTYAGDANLDGVIDGGDYGIIDNFVQVPGASGYFNGDFNYDGVIDGGDYGILDNNIQAQGGPL